MREDGGNVMKREKRRIEEGGQKREIGGRKDVRQK